jgi:hypothetical protein
MTSAMSPQWSQRSTVTNAIVAPPLCPIGSLRYSEEEKWFFYFAHLLNVGCIIGILRLRPSIALFETHLEKDTP